MNIPVENIKELLTAALDIEHARETVVSVNILIDESVDPEFQVFVRSGFNSTSANSRVLVSYFPTQTPDTTVETDVAVIVAGTNPEVGALVTGFTEHDVPCMVVCEDAQAVVALANEQNTPIPDSALVSFADPDRSEVAHDKLSDLIGTWIVDNTPEEKKLAFSIAYPFVRRPLAYDAINKTSIQNAGFGVLIFIPGADMPVMTINQAKMVLQIAAAYGEPLDADRIKELAAMLAGAFFFRGISRSLVGLVPALGWAVKGGMGYLGTQAIGHAALEYFQNGGNAAGVAAIVGDARDGLMKVVGVIRSHPTAEATLAEAGPTARKFALKALDKVAPVVQSAAKQTVANAGSVVSSRLGRKK